VVVVLVPAGEVRTIFTVPNVLTTLIETVAGSLLSAVTSLAMFVLLHPHRKQRLKAKIVLVIISASTWLGWWLGWCRRGMESEVL
jgi:zinc transporter ZupT